MGIDKIIGNSFTAEVLGKKYTIRYQVRNFIALKKRFNVDMYDLVQDVLNGDFEAIIRMIWCGTLIFNDFDLADPTSIKEEIDIKKLYEMDGGDLQKLGLDITKGLLDSLPKADAKKKTKLTGKIAEALKQIKTILKIK